MGFSLFLQSSVHNFFTDTISWTSSLNPAILSNYRTLFSYEQKQLLRHVFDLDVVFAGDPSLCYQPLQSRKCLTMNLNMSRREGHFIQMNRRHLFIKEKKSFSINYSDKLRDDSMSSEEMHVDALDVEITPPDSQDIHISQNSTVSSTLQEDRPKSFRNRFLDFVRISSVLNTAAERFFKSEIRRRLFVTAVLLVLSRVGYFIPLPGFDRRLIPQDYLSFVSGSVGECSHVI